jgi:putative hemolysin
MGFTALVLQRFFSSIPAWELKRLAGKGDHLAKSLYRVTAFGRSLRLLLWSVGILTLAGGYVLIAGTAQPAINFAILAVLLVLAFIVVPSIRLTQRSAQFAAAFSPALGWVLLHTHTVLEKVGHALNAYRRFEAHTGVYEKDDLMSLLAQQKNQPDSRLDIRDLELTEQVLQFGDSNVSSILQPRKEAHIINADDTIGPILLDSLHKHHQQSFLVYKGDREDIVGSLTMAEAVKAKHGGRVFDLVRNDLIYVHEDFSLPQALQALRQTNQSVAVVINSFEEFVGVVTLDAILQQLLGKPAAEETLPYANRSAVAAYKPQPEMSEHMPSDEPEQLPAKETASMDTPTDEPSDPVATKDTTSPGATEVVE